jgi:agmatine deiminase
MPISPRSALLTVSLMLSCGVAAPLSLAREPVLTPGGVVFPEGEPVSKGPTALEHTLEELGGPGMPRGFTPPPAGPIRCPGEYEPMAGIMIAWEGGTSFTNVLARMATHITTTGNADVYIMCDTAAEATLARNTIAALTGPAANMSRVQTFVVNTDTIWIRDYGPRYIYEGNVRALIDHTYNRSSRVNDDAQPVFWAGARRHPRYELPLVHGGGNYHLNGIGDAYATELITDENPGLSAAQVSAIWADYQNVDTTITPVFPFSVDATGHIDMWVQIAGERRVMVSQWASPPSTNPNVGVICNDFAAARAAEGWTVQRVPAFSVAGTHYTYTNVVICNDLILVPSYTNSTVVAADANNAALAAWRALRSDLPPANIVSVPCQALVTSAGVMHCVVMHVPAPIGGASPTAYLRTLRGPQTLQPGANVDILWSTDDDVSVTNVDILLSTDGGATFPTVIASQTADDGQFTWTVPSTYSTTARVRVVARDAQGNTGGDSSTANLFINAPVPPCVGDADGDRDVDFSDVTGVLASFGSLTQPFAPGDANGDGAVDFSDITTVLANFGAACG